jgi:hypothetical protein
MWYLCTSTPCIETEVRVFFVPFAHGVLEGDVLRRHGVGIGLFTIWRNRRMRAHSWKLGLGIWKLLEHVRPGMKSICSYVLAMAKYRVCNGKLTTTQNDKFHTPWTISTTHGSVDGVFWDILIESSEGRKALPIAVWMFRWCSTREVVPSFH